MVDVQHQNNQTIPRLVDGSPRFARGWFMLGTAADFPAGQTKKLFYFNTHLVAWRNQNGEMAVFEAHCPHLGAHLGVRSTVEGEHLVCAGHGARFDLQGNCTTPPHGETAELCKHLQVKTWPVREVNGVIMLWHDPEGNTPQFEIEQLKEYGAPDWSDWYFHKMELAVHPREIIENVSDKAHFVYVHQFEKLQDFRNDFHLHTATQYMKGSSERGSTLSISTYFGPAFQITWMDNTFFQSRLLNSHIPVDAHHTDLWFGVMLKKQDVDRSEAIMFDTGSEPIDPELLKSLSLDELLEAYAQTVHQGFEQDVGVWRKKLYRTSPILCDGDGPLAQCRKWYGQFYQDVKDVTPKVVAPENRLNPYINYA